MATQIDWLPVQERGRQPIGAIGFIANKAVMVIAFIDDGDANLDGRLTVNERLGSWFSPVSLKKRAVYLVAMQARVDLEIIERDGDFGRLAMQIFSTFATGLIKDAVFEAYFARPVAMAGRGVARRVSSKMVKRYVVRKGFEVAVREAFDTAAGR